MVQRLPAAMGILLLGIATNQLHLNQIIPRLVSIKSSDGGEHDGCRLTARHQPRAAVCASAACPGSTEASNRLRKVCTARPIF